MGRATNGGKPVTKRGKKIPKKPKVPGCRKGPLVLLELTEKHLLFCKRYVLTGGNAAKAARESDFDEWYAGVQLLQDPSIQKEIERQREQRRKKFEVSADRVIAELVKVAFGTLGDFLTLQKDGTPIIDCTEVGPEEMAALSEITQDVYSERQPGADGEWESIPVKKTKIKLHPKTQALEQLARIFKLFDEGGSNKDSPEQKAAKIKQALRKMMEADGA
jgi:phage terminase small subunit